MMMDVMRAVVAIVAGVALAVCASGQGSAISYQGRLEVDGELVSGVYDVRFGVFDAASGGAMVAGPVEVTGVAVSGGVFAASVDLGEAAWSGEARRWLEVAVREGGAGAYEVLPGRNEVTRAPRAVHALEAEVAAFAVDGPFAPVDPTRRSSSGLPSDAVFEAILQQGGQGAEVVEVSGVIGAFSQPPALGFWDSTLVVRRPLGSGVSSWQQHAESGAGVYGDLTLRLSSGYGVTEWSFDDIVVGSYGYGFGSDGSVWEEMSLEYPYPFGGALDFRSFSLIGGGEAPVRPTVRGPMGVASTSDAGVALWAIDGTVPSLSVASVLPRRARSVSFFAGSLNVTSYDAASAEFVRSVLAENIFGFFVGALSSYPIELRFEDGGGTVTTLADPPSGATGLGVSYRLELADDGLPVEVYEFKYDLP